jgi:hypothetical protein
MDLPLDLLEQHGWSMSNNIECCYYRCCQVNDFQWTEEIEFLKLERVTYIQSVKLRRTSSDQALGSLIKRLAPNAANIAASYYPMRRTGVGKLREYMQVEGAVKAIGESLETDDIEEERLFLVRSKVVDVQEILKRNNNSEATAHVYLMLSLQAPK